jgi:hypothetical protein
LAEFTDPVVEPNGTEQLKLDSKILDFKTGQKLDSHFSSKEEST